jgi:hypothetical protein
LGQFQPAPHFSLKARLTRAALKIRESFGKKSGVSRLARWESNVVKTISDQRVWAEQALSKLQIGRRIFIGSAGRLMQLNDSAFTATVTPTAFKPMYCAHCQDVFVTVPDRAVKGGTRLMAEGAPTKAVATHLCADCKISVKVVSRGKHSPADTVIHNCASCDTAKLARLGGMNTSGVVSVK